MLPESGRTPATQHSASPGGQRSLAGELFLDICCGASEPLPSAISSNGVPCVSVAALGTEPLHLPHDRTYAALLSLAFSGVTRFAHAAPPLQGVLSSQASTRQTRGHPQPSIPGRLPAEHRRTAIRTAIQCLAKSRILYRCITILRAVLDAGGHVSLEQTCNELARTPLFKT